jgi:hypothetical protein
MARVRPNFTVAANFSRYATVLCKADRNASQPGILMNCVVIPTCWSLRAMLMGIGVPLLLRSGHYYTAFDLFNSDNGLAFENEPSRSYLAYSSDVLEKLRLVCTVFDILRRIVARFQLHPASTQSRRRIRNGNFPDGASVPKP